MRSFVAAASALAVAGCVAGPEYIPPTPQASTLAPFIGGVASVVSEAPAEDGWWRLFKDPVLDRLICEALSANTDIRVAVARLGRARAGASIASHSKGPKSAIELGVDYQRVPERQLVPGSSRELWDIDGGLEVSYEADLFGRISREIEAARGDVGAAAADVDAVRLTVVADTTRAYADAASNAERLAVARHIVDLLDQSIQITTSRFDVGLASRLDVVRLAALRDKRKAEIPSLEAARTAALFRLATLTGKSPQELSKDAGARALTLSLSRAIPIGDGKQLLARRPDLRAAERRLAADTARIGVATADLYPRITLGGSVGSTGNSAGDLLGGGAFRWLAGPLISWTFLDQAAVRARIAVARADTDASLATFDGVVLRALEETEAALSAYSNEFERHEVLETARSEAAEAARIVHARLLSGQIDYLTVLDTERSSADAEAELVESSARLVDKQIDLFLVLGGVWSQAVEGGKVPVASSSQAELN